MSGRRYGVLAGLALIVAQICCAPPIQAQPAGANCPLKFQGGCPMRHQNTCSATAPQRSTAIKPKPASVVAIVPRPATRQIASVAMVYLLATATPSVERAPLDLVLRI